LAWGVSGCVFLVHRITCGFGAIGGKLMDCTKSVPKLYQPPRIAEHLGIALSEEQIPKLWETLKPKRKG
jgi:hypothetical protein